MLQQDSCGLLTRLGFLDLNVVVGSEVHSCGLLTRLGFLD